MLGKLLPIKETITKEYTNLYKNKTRSRSLENINEKIKRLNDLYNKYKAILNKLKSTLIPVIWNTEYEKFEVLKMTYLAAIKILEESIILETARPKIKFKTVGKAVSVEDYSVNQRQGRQTHVSFTTFFLLSSEYSANAFHSNGSYN